MSISWFGALRRLVGRAAYFGTLLTLFLGCTHRLAASSGEAVLPNLALPTAGGQQLWADRAWQGGWRVQQHAWTGHCRLLDPDDVRRSWGSEKACLLALGCAEEAGAIREARERAVVMLHGLWRSRDSMAPLALAFEEAGYDVIDLAYASTRGSVARHADGVEEVLERLPHDYAELSFVTHSLGALVVRDLLARSSAPWLDRHALGRAVFIAAPNGGAALSQVAASIPGAFSIYGEPSREIAAGLPARLPVPSIPFMTIAASRGEDDGWNPLIPGDDDGVVGVSEAQLEGSTQHLVVPGVHTFVMRSPDVIRACLDFVEATREV